MWERLKTGNITKRDFLQLLGAGGIAVVLASILKQWSDWTSEPYPSLPHWPVEREEILQRIEQLQFKAGSELRTNFFPRKSMWEAAQLLKLKGQWQEGDESDWRAHPDIIGKHLDVLVAAGVKGARLVIAPFEVTTDGKVFDWTAIDTALRMFAERGLIASLSVGPLKFPFGPDGVRLPIELQQQLANEAASSGATHLEVSLETSNQFPVSLQAIKDFSLHFLEAIVTRYADDPRIDKFYLDNEWPDTNSIEGVPGVTLSVDEDLMIAAIEYILQATDKPIALNTNIPPFQLRQLKSKLGPLLTTLGDRGILGLDPYPTREAQDPAHAREMLNYGQHVERIREAFPATTIIFTEYQAEPWPPVGIQGKPWAEIMRYHLEEVVHFYQVDFPRALEPYLVGSGISEIGLYGAPLWPIAAELGYEFPLEMLGKIAQRMELT